MMSREIKFRAWDKRDKKYLDNAQNMWMNNTCFGDLLASPNFEIEQYTGLKDSNGDDIYENDIIKVSDETGSSFVSVVKYFDYDDYPAFDLDPQYIPTDWYFETNILSILKADGTEIKVVGNVHTSLELLEVGK